MEKIGNRIKIAATDGCPGGHELSSTGVVVVENMIALELRENNGIVPDGATLTLDAVRRVLAGRGCSDPLSHQ